MGLSKDDDIPRSPAIFSRQASSGSDVTEEESLLSPTTSVNTAMTSLLEPSSLPPSPSSSIPSKPGETDQLPPIENGQDTFRVASAKPNPQTPIPLEDPSQIESHTELDPAQSTESEDNSELESPVISTPPASLRGCRVLEDEKIRSFVEVEFVDVDEEEKRDSWASYETAKSSPEPLSVVEEVEENASKEVLKDDTVVAIASQEVSAGI